jgi:hypothetical protein
MPLHFFNIDDGRGIVDDVGADIPDLTALRREALQTAGELLRDGGGGHLWSGHEWKMVVTDGQGREVLVLRFSAEERGSTRHDAGQGSLEPVSERTS